MHVYMHRSLHEDYSEGVKRSLVIYRKGASGSPVLELLRFTTKTAPGLLQPPDEEMVTKKWTGNHTSSSTCTLNEEQKTKTGFVQLRLEE